MDQKIRLEKGEELGRFNMGSTVIILMPNDFPNLSLEEGQALKMGQSIT
jgi:phosphatidylserine decarboxylase